MPRVRHAYRLVGGRHDAEDAMPASFLELWRRRERVTLIDGSILRWMLDLTTNTAKKLQPQYLELGGGHFHRSAPFVTNHRLICGYASMHDG
jgi:hypothetical protein